MRTGISSWLMVGVALVPSALFAQSARSSVEEANRLYAEGRYAEAQVKYLEALRADPSSPVIRFNEGNALYQSQEYQRALEAYRDAIESGDPGLAPGAWYNVGNSFFRQQQLEASIEAYKQALRIDPNDDDAKHNLERALQQLEEQEQNPDQNPEQGNDDQDRDNESEGQGEQQRDPEDPGDEEQEDDSGDPNDEEQPQPDPNEGEPEGEQPQDVQPPPGQMSREEAERLLQAIQEDPDEVDRPPRADLLGRRPRKDW